jgi:hypothetical protein
MEPMGLLESLNIPFDGLDVVKKEEASNFKSEDGERIDFVEPKMEEVTVNMTTADVQTFTFLLKEEPFDGESTDVEMDNKWEPQRTIVKDCAKQHMEEALENVSKIKNKENTFDDSLFIVRMEPRGFLESLNDPFVGLDIVKKEKNM